MSNASQHIININQSDIVAEEITRNFYQANYIKNVLQTTLDYFKSHQVNTALPYFSELDSSVWNTKPKELDVYITDVHEAKALNLQARNKNYATNILSYPSELPALLLEQLPNIPLGELIICHDVVAKQADEHAKTIHNHMTHLIIHGILHLLGFDHELGQAQQDNMEHYEIEILQSYGIKNPYI